MTRGLMFVLVYVMGLKDGRIKIGSSYRMAQRQGEHKRRHGPDLAWFRVFERSTGRPGAGRFIERDAIHSLARVATRIEGTDWFADATREQAFAAVRAAHVSAARKAAA